MRRNLFSLSHKVNFSCDQGELIPVGCVEVLPGDIFRHGTSLLIRLAPMLAPIFSQLNVTIFQFYVPTRIVWDNFEKFITGGPDGDDNTEHPYIQFASGVAAGSLGDYFGIPPGVNNPGGVGVGVSAIPFRMYAKIFNEWIRDEDLDTELTVSTADGADTTTNTTLQNIRWEKDYFTAARPFEQKGTSVTIPVGNQAPVKGIGVLDATATAAMSAGMRQTDGTVMTGQQWSPGAFNAGNIAIKTLTTGNIGVGNYPQIYADLSAVTGIPISELRLANALQRFMELSSHRGSRYVEYLLSRFGVRSSDARLQRPELLSRSKSVVQISEVVATAETGTSVDVGDLKGHGIGAMRGNRYMRMFEEHGYVMTLMAVQPKTMYVQGIHRSWLRRDKYDYFQPETAFIGDQEVFNSEIYAAAATPGGTFGWTPRHQEYREHPNRIAGEFRTSTLDFWHQARIFSSEPALNAAFVTSNPTERIFAVPSQDVLYITANHSIQARRVIPKIATPFLR